MTDYIKREDAIKLACSDCEPYSCDKNCTLMQILKMTPAADVVERKHGKWIINGNDAMCSNCNDIFCGDWADIDLIADCDMNFCPNCGADMRGES